MIGSTHLSRNVLFIAGPIGAGKSTLARALSAIIPRASASTFSSGLRRLGEREGILLDSRSALQDYGEHVARARPQELWRATVETSDQPDAPNLLIDGLRHLHIFRMVREMPESDAYLLTLWPSPAEVARRRRTRGDMQIDDAHDVESGIQAITELSDIVLRGRIADTVQAEDVARLLSPIWTAPA